MRPFLFVLFLSFFTSSYAQQHECVAFYNLENLFDTQNDTSINDEEYLPEAGWTEELYAIKLSQMSSILSKIGKDKGLDGPCFLGVSEIENRKVLEDLLKDSSLVDHNYSILHFDGPDRRGVDVAAFYKADRFTPLFIRSIPAHLLRPDSTKKYTRDVLYVKGLMSGEIVHITVNHWPSRYGGKKASGPFREAVAKVNRQLLDSLLAADDVVNFVVMGDLNDDPSNKSVKKILRAGKHEKGVTKNDLFNPFYRLYQKGVGSNAWDDAWHNFDQIIVSHNLTEAGLSRWKYKSAKIYKKDYMLQRSGRYKGYPLRTKAGGEYTMGYSDHFPVLVYFEKR